MNLSCSIKIVNITSIVSERVLKTWIGFSAELQLVWNEPIIHFSDQILYYASTAVLLMHKSVQVVFSFHLKWVKCDTVLMVRQLKRSLERVIYSFKFIVTRTAITPWNTSLNYQNINIRIYSWVRSMFKAVPIKKRRNNYVYIRNKHTEIGFRCVEKTWQ